MEGGRRRRLRNVQNNESLDRISELPDSLLLHILSFLPTKNAVCTSILSKRWVNLWIDLPVLEFEFWVSPTDMRKYARKKVSFKNFVNRVLLLNHASRIERCKFDRIYAIDSAHKNAWMAALSARQVRELVLEDCVIDMVGPDSYFFHKLFSFESLSVLRMTVTGFKYAPNVMKFWLPNLKFLTLDLRQLFDYPSYDDVEDFLHRLLPGCPVLEELNVYLYHFRCIEIHSSTLRTLHVLSMEQGSHVVILEAPNLKKLNITNADLFYVGNNTPILTKANIKTPSCEALRAISNSKATTLHLGYCNGQRQPDWEKNLPRFDNLTVLKLVICSTCDPVCGLILGMLKNCPHMQNFTLHFHNVNSRKCDGMPPYCVPQCLRSSLTYFEMHGDELLKSDVDILKYFLRNGAVLKEIKLIGFTKERGALKKILTPYMRSRTCTVTFCEHTY